MSKNQILIFINYWLNYWLKALIFIIWIYLYNIGSITISRIGIFIMVFLLIYGYSRFAVLINYIFLNQKVIKYVEDNSAIFRKIVYILLEVYKWVNPLIVFLIYTDKLLYKIVRYISGTKFINYNFVLYLIVKYYLMFGLIKLIIYKYYNIWYKLYRSTIIEILFKRMYGLILSILIFTEFFNNIISYLSHYGIWVYILIYYVISSICIGWELLYSYYLWYKIDNKKIAYLIYLFDKNFQVYTKTNNAIFLRSQFTWLGRTITDILGILILKENNFKEEYLSLTKVKEGSYFMSGRIIYYKPLENRIPLKYFDYFGGVIDFGFIESIFELYWLSFKSNLFYNSFFKPISEIKGKPSIFLYKYIQELSRLYDVYNQPINRLMNWMYFDIKLKESLSLLNESEKSIVSKNLMYFNKVDKLRAKLMYFIIWDIEYYYNNNKKEYNWDYWIIQYDTMLDKLVFIIDGRFSNNLLHQNIKVAYKYIFNNKNILKFYDPEENIAYFNRLFNVLGMVNIELSENKYYVSKKFNNYNKKYVELLKIMYSYDFKRWEENMCECSTFSSYEVEISYKTEDYFKSLRAEWEGNITEELASRNWRLLIELEEAMAKI